MPDTRKHLSSWLAIICDMPRPLCRFQDSALDESQPVCVAARPDRHGAVVPHLWRPGGPLFRARRGSARGHLGDSSTCPSCFPHGYGPNPMQHIEHERARGRTAFSRRRQSTAGVAQPMYAWSRMTVVWGWRRQCPLPVDGTAGRGSARRRPRRLSGPARDGCDSGHEKLPIDGHETARWRT